MSSSSSITMTDCSKDGPSCTLPFIELIWNEIISYLSIEDQIKVALVCEKLCHMVQRLQDKNYISFTGLTYNADGSEIECLDDMTVFLKKLQSAQPRLLRECHINNSFEAFFALLNNRDVCQYLEFLNVSLTEDWRGCRIQIPVFSKLKQLILRGESFPEAFVALILENCPQLCSFSDYLYRNPDEYQNEGAYLLSLPKTVKQLHCFLVYQPLLANLCSALENNGIKLEILTLIFYNNFRHDHGHFDHDDVRSIIPWIYGSVTDLILINCEGHLADFIKMKNLKRIMITTDTIISNEEAKLFLSHCQTIEHIQIGGNYQLLKNESYNSANYISLIKHLGLLRNLTSFSYICRYDCNILGILAHQASSLQVFSCVVRKDKMTENEEITFEGIHRMVNKLQKTLRVLKIERTDYDDSVFIELINSALDTPRTFTIHLPQDADEGYSKETVGRITVIHNITVSPPERS